MSYNGDDEYADEEYVTGVMRPPRRWPYALAAAVLVAGVAAAVIASDDDDSGTRPRAAATPTRTPSPSSSPSASDSPTPEPTPTPAPSPTAVPSVSASPAPSLSPAVARTPTVSPTRPAASRTPSPARPPAGYPPKGLTLEVQGEPIPGDVPQVRFRIHVRDNDGDELEGVIDYGDGTKQFYSRRPATTCPSRPNAPPPGYRPAPIDRRFTVTHAYENGGQYTVTVTAKTGRTCLGTPEESTFRRLTVTVPPRVEPSPTTSAAATPPPSGAPRP